MCLSTISTIRGCSIAHARRAGLEMNLGSSDPEFVRDLIDKVFDPEFAAAAELQERLPAVWKNTFASNVASQL